LFIILLAKRLDGAFDVGAPSIERVLAFGKEIVSLVNGGNTRNRPFLVVENLIGNMRRRSKPGHAGNYSSKLERPDQDHGPGLPFWRYRHPESVVPPSRNGAINCAAMSELFRKGWPAGRLFGETA
jgi:hypothetical protein